MLIPAPYRDAAALFAAGGPLPYLWLDGRYLVATDKVQMIVFQLDEEHTGPAAALPLDIGTNVTIMDGMILSELGLHVSPEADFPDWRKVYRRTEATDKDATSDAPLLGRLLLANELLGGGQILMQSGAQWQSKFSLGNGKAHVFWMPFTPLAHIDEWVV